MAKKYFMGFEDLNDIIRDFEISTDELAPKEDEIIIAAYGGSGYDGEALIVFERDGKLYEVHGSHCSCYGLEDGWEPEETSWAALKMWKLNQDDWDDEFLKAWKDLLEKH